MKRSLLLFLILGTLLLCIGLWLVKSDPQQNALRAREMATRGLASYLADHRLGNRVLIISNPFTQQQGIERGIVEMEDAGIRGVRLGMGTKLPLGGVAFPELKAEARANPRALLPEVETTTPLSYLVADDAFDQVARDHPDCDLFVSLIGVPAELERVQVWRMAGPPKFALLLPDLSLIGNATAVRNSFKTGKLAAFVLTKPGAPDSNAPIGGDFQTEFERRFLLVTAENLDRMMQAFPQLFPPD